MDAPRGPRIIAVYNNKGGVAKTTTTVNIAACLAELGYRTLVIDLDPQANATSSLGIDSREVAVSLKQVLINRAPMEDLVEPTAIKNLFVAPARPDLGAAEQELTAMLGRESRLKYAVDPIADQWDFILIDCPPSAGMLTDNALTAATEVLTPIGTQYLPLEGIPTVEARISSVREFLNPGIPSPRFILVMYQNQNLDNEVVSQVRAFYGDRVLKTVVPRNVRVAEAPSYGQPITTYDSSSTGAQAYRDATKELIDGA